MAKNILIGVLLLAVLGGGIYAVRSSSGDSNESSTAASQDESSVMGDMTMSDTMQRPENTAATANQNTADSVEIKDYSYNPGTRTVKKGTTVTWTNQDAVRHDVAPDTVTDEFKKSELLSKGESYSVTFNRTGTYTYHCSPHPYMKGTITVTE